MRRHYIRTLHRVVDEAALVLLVIDARNPVGCRSWLVEEEVSRREAGSKRLVCVRNKIGAHAVYLPPPFSFSDRLGALRECPGMDDASPSYEEAGIYVCSKWVSNYSKDAEGKTRTRLVLIAQQDVIHSLSVSEPPDGRSRARTQSE